MPRTVSARSEVAEQAMEMQAQLRRTSAALGAAAMATGNWTVMAEVHALRRLADATAREAKRIAGVAERHDQENADRREPRVGVSA